MKKLILFLLIFITVDANAQDTTYIMTSARCGMCKDRIESKMSKNKFIYSSDLNLETKVLTVIHDKRITKKYLKIMVTKIGYDANDVPAVKSAYKRLPLCCRKEFSGNCTDEK